MPAPRPLRSLMQAFPRCRSATLPSLFSAAQLQHLSVLNLCVQLACDMPSCPRTPHQEAEGWPPACCPVCLLAGAAHVAASVRATDPEPIIRWLITAVGIGRSLGVEFEVKRLTVLS